MLMGDLLDHQSPSKPGHVLGHNRCDELPPEGGNLVTPLFIYVPPSLARLAPLWHACLQKGDGQIMCWAIGGPGLRPVG